MDGFVAWFDSFHPARGIVILRQAQDRFPQESFVAPSIHVGQLETDSCGMTEFLTGKRQPDIAVRQTVFRCILFLNRQDELLYFGYAQDRFPQESFVAPSRDVG